MKVIIEMAKAAARGGIMAGALASDRGAWRNINIVAKIVVAYQSGESSKAAGENDGEKRENQRRRKWHIENSSENDVMAKYRKQWISEENRSNQASAACVSKATGGVNGSGNIGRKIRENGEA